MDKQDFEVTVRETWEGIERAIDELALDGVEVYPEDKGLRLMFDDGTFISLQRNDTEQQIDLIRGDARLPFYWDAVEEHWYARGDERPLLAVLSEVIGEKIARSVTLPDLL
jgi:frataxin-like iron-binding protein CyaY